MKYCSKCGYANNDEVTYCSCCGASLQIKKPEVVINNSTKRCSNCGNENNSNSRFCARCGKELDENNQSNGENYKYCSKCGSRIFKGDSFCLNCGRPVDQANTDVKQKNSKNDGLGVAAKVLSILSCVGIGLVTLIWIFAMIVLFLFEDSGDTILIAVPLGIYTIIFLALFIVDISLTISLCRKLDSGDQISTGFKIAILLVVNLIAGVLLLCREE